MRGWVRSIGLPWLRSEGLSLVDSSNAFDGAYEAVHWWNWTLALSKWTANRQCCLKLLQYSRFWHLPGPTAGNGAETLAVQGVKSPRAEAKVRICLCFFVLSANS